MVAWPERQRIEDRASSEIVHVLSPVHIPRMGSPRREKARERIASPRTAASREYSPRRTAVKANSAARGNAGELRSVYPLDARRERATISC